MWTALFSAIAAMPQLVNQILAFIKWIEQMLAVAVKNKTEEDLKKAIEKAKKDKNTGDLDAIFDPSKKP